MVNQNFSRYLRFFTAFVGGYFFLSALLIIGVDPYNEFGLNRTGLYFDTGLQAKSQIQQVSHNALLIGSSRTGRIDPEDIACMNFYNASFANALPEQMFYYLKRFAVNEKLVVMGLDFYMFNERQFPIDQVEALHESRYSMLEYITSFKVLRHAIEALYRRAIKKEEPVIGKKGNLTENWETQHLKEEINIDHNLPHDGKVNTGNQLKQFKKGRVDYSSYLKMLRDHHYRRYFYSKERLVYLNKIKELLNERHIPHMVFINPVNPAVLDLYRDLKLDAQFAKWKEDLATIFPDVVDLSSGKYSDMANFGYKDPSHYKSEVGVEFLNNMVCH